MIVPTMKNTVDLAFQGPRIFSKYPHAYMNGEEQKLFAYFTDELKWGKVIHSRVSFDHLMNAREFSNKRVILDAGAGHQRYRPFFNNSNYLTQEHPSGIDFKKMNSIQYDFISPIDQFIPLKDNSIACVINTSVLEHVRFPESFFREVHRVLLPGGRIYMSVPFSYLEHEQPYDFQRPTRYGLGAWLSDAGFRKKVVLPASNSTYGASAFIIGALSTELPLHSAGHSSQSLMPIVKYCVDACNNVTDDFISVDAKIPIGWLVIAEKDGNLPEPHFENREEWIRKNTHPSYPARGP
jgi:SAM-dependent methyltransferase